MKHCQPANLSEWINWISDPCIDPWPSGRSCPTPVDFQNAIIIDPTYNFESITDDQSDDEDGSEQV